MATLATFTSPPTPSRPATRSTDEIAGLLAGALGAGREYLARVVRESATSRTAPATPLTDLLADALCDALDRGRRWEREHREVTAVFDQAGAPTCYRVANPSPYHGDTFDGEIALAHRAHWLVEQLADATRRIATLEQQLHAAAEKEQARILTEDTF